MSKTFLFISAQYLPTAGGVERFTNSLARRLTIDGHRVIVATSSLKGLPDHETDNDGIEVIRFPSIPFMDGRLPLLRPCADFRKLSSLLWDQKIDYCVINTYFYPLSMYAASQTHRKKIPTLIINHGSAWLMTGSRLLRFAGQLYERTAAWLCNHYCPRFFGVSDAAQKWMNTFSIQAEGIITNAIDPFAIETTVNSEIDWRMQLKLSSDAKLIAFVGRMIPEKGVEPLIAAMASIRQVHPNAYLVIAGNGPLYEKYLDSHKDGVILLGVQKYPNVLALLKQADLFCLPSRSEGFACTVLEAAALGCPIITTATGGSPHLLIQEEYGLLLANMEPNTIADTCIRALSDENWRRQAAVLTRQRLLENYTWDASLAQLYQALGI